MLTKYNLVPIWLALVFMLLVLVIQDFMAVLEAVPYFILFVTSVAILSLAYLAGAPKKNVPHWKVVRIARGALIALYTSVLLYVMVSAKMTDTEYLAIWLFMFLAVTAASGLYYGQARLAYWTDHVLCFYYTGASLVRGFPGRCE